MKARFVYRAWKARLRNHRAELRAVASILRPGDVAVDVGAHKGIYLYWLRRGVGERGRVFAFEPQQALARYLRDACGRMHWSNVVVSDAALSDSAGTRTLHVPGRDTSAGASLEKAILEISVCREVECRTDTLDRELEGIGGVTLLKVDVEGHELEVFRGATRILTRQSPMILFECEARHLRRHSMGEVFGFLEGLGYTGWFFSPDGLRPVAEFDAAIHQRRTPGRFWDPPSYLNNFLFRKPGSPGALPSSEA